MGGYVWCLGKGGASICVWDDGGVEGLGTSYPFYRLPSCRVSSRPTFAHVKLHIYNLKELKPCPHSPRPCGFPTWPVYPHQKSLPSIHPSIRSPHATHRGRPSPKPSPSPTPDLVGWTLDPPSCRVVPTSGQQIHAKGLESAWFLARPADAGLGPVLPLPWRGGGEVKLSKHFALALALAGTEDAVAAAQAIVGCGGGCAAQPFGVKAGEDRRFWCRRSADCHRQLCRLARRPMTCENLWSAKD